MQAKTENRNQFVDLMRGIAMLLVNYVITVALTVMAIVMMNQNAVLSFVLTGKKK